MSILYKGNAHVYLQGMNALMPIRKKTNKITYYIGDRKTKLLLRDFRQNPVDAAHKVLQGEKDFEFADIFNQSAQVKVQVKDKNKIEIDLHDSPDGDNYPTLWLGILDDNLFPNYETEWEFLRPTSLESTAIAVLVSQNS